MSGLEPFEPDDIYCVHCHAPAVGMCAQCGALCCGDCVELRMGWTRHQAVCRLCLRDEPPRVAPWRYAWIVGAVSAAALVGWWFWR